MPQDKPIKPSVLELVKRVLGNMGLDDPTTVEVTAPRPKLSSPGPENMEEIWLGSKDQKPLGVYFPPEREGKVPTLDNLPPDIAAAVNKAIERWPHAASLVDRITVSDDLDKRTKAVFTGGGERLIQVNPTLTKRFSEDDIISTLGHEFTHAGGRTADPGQFGRYNPPFMRLLANLDIVPQDWVLGEDAAYATQRKTLMNIMAENVKKAEEAKAQRARTKDGSTEIKLLDPKKKGAK